MFGSQSGRKAPQLDARGHIVDPNMEGSYESGPSNRACISDPTDPEYDPAIDPNLQLRTVRTAAESIAESHRSEARRDARAKAKRKGSMLKQLGRGRTLLRRQQDAQAGRNKAGFAADAVSGINDMIHSELGRIRQASSTHASGATGTGGEGIGVAFESAQQDRTPAVPTADDAARAEDEARAEKAAAASAASSGGAVDLKKKKKGKPARRRNVYLNMAPTAAGEVNKHGEPSARYPRNKVRTSKYTIITFLPRFLAEQFRRLANVYFLMLVLLQTSDKFGATVPQIAMLPLVAILGITAIKDGLEDYRRHILDNQVNNSAVTKLGNWRNSNQPRDPRNWAQKLLGTGKPHKVSKGVKKLREKEDAIGLSVVGKSRHDLGAEGKSRFADEQASRGRGRRSDSLNSGYTPGLDTIVSLDSQPASAAASPYKPDMSRKGSSSALLYGQSSGTLTRASSGPGTPGDGVLDYTHQKPGTALWERTLWKKLEVGDVVLLREDEQVPADIVLLSSSDPDGSAFVETKNLDGETNLKVRKCVKATMGIQTEEDIEHARFVIDSEPPHANLYSYNALLKYTASSSSGSEEGNIFGGSDTSSSVEKVEPITSNELLLRGCALRNTEWIIGIVVFTGKDTKIMLNGGDTPSKRSKIEKETNVNVAIMFLILMGMCVACGVVGGLEWGKTGTSRNFYEPGAADSSSNVVNALFIFGSCLVLFQNIVPISLYISIELTKTISAFFIYQDVDMYYEPLDHPCVPKTWGIVDDLGQIEYVFSDKTGTLTQNVMEFKKCSIDGVQYGEGVTEAMIGAMKREGRDTSGYDPETQAQQLEAQRAEMVGTMNRTFKNRFLRQDKVTLISPRLADDLAGASGPQQKANITDFFRALAVCHTALADRTGADPFSIEYKAQSPDEAALVSAARDVGAVFLNKNNQTIDIEVQGTPERLTPLNVLEFNSTRKRMSIIVRDSQGRLMLVCKGADSVIYQRLRDDHPQALKDKTQQDLEDFANAGLRTLCISYRYLDEGEYLEWARLYDEAAASLVDREDNIDEVCEKIEVGLTLIGATALEDKLQVGVPEAIEKLHEAGIKLWILTGDKLQTAIEIGFSCNLLSSSMEIMIISADHEQGARAQLEAACNKIAASGRPVVVRATKRGVLSRHRKSEKQTFSGADVDASDKSGFAVVVDGETLKFCLDKNLKPLFLALTTQCETVVCCRVSPAQKALTVRLVKDGIGAMTLSIGDGANDVSMIQEAHVGVGIAGLEGAQASMSADYAIGQFRFLAKLLLVHGHWNAYRIGVLHQVFFYKNLIWTFALFFFQIFCQWDAAYLFDYSLVLLYNLVFTSLPVIMLGSLDQDVRAPALLAYPKTYAEGREGKLYTRAQFWTACIDGVYQSVVCFAIAAGAYYFFPVVNSDGLSLDPLTAFGTTIGAACIVSANLYCGLMLMNWSVIIWVVIIISNLSYFVWILIYSAPAFGTFFSSTAYVLFGTTQFWAILVLSVAVSLLPRYTYIAFKSSFMPSYVDLVRQAWIKGELKQSMGLRPPKNGQPAEKDDAGLESGHVTPLDTPRSAALALGKPFLSGDEEGLSAKGRSRSRGMSRAESAFSFYDPDKLPAAYTPEPDMDITVVSDSMRKHKAEKSMSSVSQSSDMAHSSPPSVPRIHVDAASTTGARNSAGSLSASGSAQFGAHDVGVAPYRRDARPAASTDSFEQQFSSAFEDDATPAASQIQHSRPSISAEEFVQGSPEPSPLQRFHSRFDAH